MSLGLSGGMLTCQIEGSWAGAQAPSAFSGSIAYDTSSQDQLAQLNFGRYILEDWNILVDVNLGGVVGSFPRLMLREGRA